MKPYAANARNDRTRAPSTRFGAPSAPSIDEQRDRRGVDFHCYQSRDAGRVVGRRDDELWKKAAETRVSVLLSPVKRDLAQSRLTLTNGSIDVCGFVTLTLCSGTYFPFLID